MSKFQISSKVFKLGKYFQICYSSSFDELSDSKAANLLHTGQLSNSYFEIVSKSIVTQKLLQLWDFHKIICSATFSLTITWHIVWGSIACFSYL